MGKCCFFSVCSLQLASKFSKLDCNHVFSDTVWARFWPLRPVVWLVNTSSLDSESESESEQDADSINDTRFNDDITKQEGRIL
ncbi:hypothetical protein HanHA300_Chr03g0096621 [Helianthus annuus]|nr:hypothetical protein HanHA300_Chr03g0096621 [Helianthus annuus]KAJ0608416.1 hypothetical protein HanHA89_Chr03g0108311 [Helianthus annuus]KAJ0768479.1 hypothetical protein HanLR1_Chr03g0101671 [Helianthus annuus]KAJ0774229.1 hypothetical protein HanOQP8_Chr03g0109191 [Helianthus annuus]